VVTSELPWYKGPTLVEVLARNCSINKPPIELVNSPLKFSVLKSYSSKYHKENAQIAFITSGRKTKTLFHKKAKFERKMFCYLRDKK
jgi:translation elongation factor EF-1alpha